jgi:hypothetical protein
MRSSVSDTGCSPPPALAARQRHVQRLGLELGLQFGICQRLAAVAERIFNGLLGQVDGGAMSLFFRDGQGCHALHQFGHSRRLAQNRALAFSRSAGVAARSKLSRAPATSGVQLVHVCSGLVKTKKGLRATREPLKPQAL